jgi:excisionase family DNA binding protein
LITACDTGDLPVTENNAGLAGERQRKVGNSLIDNNSPYQLKSLASRIRGIHHALNAEELAELLRISRITILRRRAKRGSIPSFRVGTCVRFDPAAISKWLLAQGVQSMSRKG